MPDIEANMPDAEEPFRHTTIWSGNIPLHVVESGLALGASNAATLQSEEEVNGELILFLHGFPECWYSWRHIMRQLDTRYRVVAADCRGYNLSGKPINVEHYSMRYSFDDIRAIMAHYRVQKMTLVGHDWGGMAAWYFAARFPEQVAHLVTINAPHPNCFQTALDHDAVQRAASQYINRFRAPECEARLLAAGLEQFWQNLFGEAQQKGLFSNADKAIYLAAWAQPGALTGMLNWYRAAPFVVPAPDAAMDISHALSEQLKVSVPTLVIWGMKDNILLPTLLAELDAYVDNLTIHRVADGGHGLIHEMPITVAALIGQFIDKPVGGSN